MYVNHKWPRKAKIILKVSVPCHSWHRHHTQCPATCALQWRVSPSAELVFSLDQKAPSKGPLFVDMQPTPLECPSLDIPLPQVDRFHFPVGKISHLVFFFSSQKYIYIYHLHFFLFLMWKGESNNTGLALPCLFNFHRVSSPFSHYQDNHKTWLGQDFIFNPRWKSCDSERFHDWPKEGGQREVNLEARSSDSS